MCLDCCFKFTESTDTTYKNSEYSVVLNPSMSPLYMWVFLIIISVGLVSCQPQPHFESNGRILTNNSYIYYAKISDGDSALKCVTDSDNCCNDSHVGNWTDERGRSVQQGADEATCLYVTRGHGVVSLNRKSDCIPESSGLRRCDIRCPSELRGSRLGPCLWIVFPVITCTCCQG